MDPADLLVLDDGEAKSVRVEGARHAGDAFERSRLVDVELVRCDLSGCDFSESVWHRVRVVDCRMTGVELSQATLRDVSFVDCKLDDANFKLSKLRNVRFESCVLVAAEFVASAWEQVVVPGCDLRGADLSQVKCADVDLRDARLEGMKGVASLGGATISGDQLVGLALVIAHAMGIKVEPTRSDGSP